MDSSEFRGGLFTCRGKKTIESVKPLDCYAFSRSLLCRMEPDGLSGQQEHGRRHYELLGPSLHVPQLLRRQRRHQQQRYEHRTVRFRQTFHARYTIVVSFRRRLRVRRQRNIRLLQQRRHPQRDPQTQSVAVRWRRAAGDAAFGITQDEGFQTGPAVRRRRETEVVGLSW